MNIPNNSNAADLPEDARGNPAYEQTRQDMPMFCCGTNCGRNSRVVVLILCLVGIAASTFCILSTNYFSFFSLRDDTFYDEDKTQPEPFQYAKQANVGLFRYEVTELYEYPWPPASAQFPGSRRLQEEVDVGSSVNTTSATDTGITTDVPTANATGDTPSVIVDVGADDDANATVVPASDVPSSSPTSPPSAAPSAAPTETPSSPPSAAPSTEPSSAPSTSNPNDLVRATTPVNTILKYEEGMDQFDTTFHKAQMGALMAPIFAGVGTIFGLIELCCCTYKCSWFPTALFLYLAFMFQGFTLFLFLSEDFCKYAQDCALGIAGIMSVVAIVCYMISNTLICCTPRPNPFFNLCKKPPVKRKKKKKKKKDPEQDALNPDYDPDNPEAFRDEPIDVDEGFVDPYDDEDHYYSDDDEEEEEDEFYIPPDTLHTGDDTLEDEDVYNDNQDRDYDEDSYAADTFGGDTYGEDTYGNDTYADESALAENSQMTDGGWSTGEEDSELSSRYT